MPHSRLLTLEQACTCIQQGGVIAYPTETFFGVGCSVFNEKGIAGVYRAKQRASHMALPVIIGAIEQLLLLTPHIGETEQSLIRDFWPGSLSILFSAHATIPATVTGGMGTLAVRLTPHRGAAALASCIATPLVATSANISGRPAVTSVLELDEALLARLDGVYDAPPAPSGGLASTLVRCESSGNITVLRQGCVSIEQLCHAGYRVSF